jgi:hypothetical protein
MYLTLIHVSTSNSKESFMLHPPILKYVSSISSLLILSTLLLLITSIGSPNPAATTIISFEALSAPGSGTGGLQVRNQFAANGVIFQPVTALDYSQGIPIPNFAHSGTKAVELCHAEEFCRSKLDVSFTAPQRRVKLWVGYSGRLDSQQIVIMRAFDGGGNQIAADLRILGPSTDVIPIATPLEVNVPSATVVRVTASFLGAESQNPQIFNNGLAFDDLEFDDQGSAPRCQATQLPAFAVNEPTEGRVVLQNAFTLDANLTTPDAFATLQINVTGQTAAATRTFGPTFAASGHISIFNLSGLLFPGRNTVVFIVRDCFGSRQVTRTVFLRNDVTRTGVRVINENGASVSGAQVYANGTYLGNTDQTGMVFTSPPLQSGTTLVARQFIKENSTYRKNHSKGSFQDWNYRVYISNIAVDNNGSLINSNRVNYEPDPLAPQVVRVRRNNALFGLHVVASVEWDASAAEMEVVRQKLLAASKYLYNATDGQILIEQAEVVDDAKYWRDADYRIYADQSLREYVDSPLGGFLSGFILPNLPPLVLSRIHVNILSSGPTYAHEFGHYGFAVRDEYKDDHPEVHCTALLSDDSPSNPFVNGSPRASCMMWSPHGKVRRKLCSGRRENPHAKGTRQGDSSCWSTLASHYQDSSNRWILKTPDTRGAIPGPVNDGNPPLAAWAPRIMFENNTRPNLCQPIRFKTAEKKREIWLETTYGADILEGKTNKDTGELTATGLHVGDNVEGLTIKPENCTPIAMAVPAPGITSPTASAFALAHAVPIAFSQSPEGQQVLQLEIAPAAFNIFTTLKPTTGEGAEISVRVEASSGKEIVTLPKPPAVKILMRGQEARYVSLRYSTGAKVYVGTVEKLPTDTEVEIEVTATDQRRNTVHTVGRFRMSVPHPGYETDIESADGQLSLTIPAKALPRGARVAFGPTSSSLPSLPEGYSVLAGPISVWSFPDNRLSQPGTLRFQVPQQSDGSGFEGYSDKTLKVFHYDPENQKWEDIGGVVHPYPIDIVTVQTSRLGLFALVGMKTGKEYQESALSMAMFKPHSSFPVGSFELAVRRAGISNLVFQDLQTYLRNPSP